MRTSLFFAITFLLSFSALAQVTPDTLEIGGATIIRDNDTLPRPVAKKGFFKKLDTQISPGEIKTAYLVMDIGFADFADATDYTSPATQTFAPGSNQNWFEISPAKSHNFNIWAITQTFNLVNHVVNFQYAAGLEFNNYRFKQPIRFAAQKAASPDAPVVILDPLATGDAPSRTYKKDKLAAHYLTVPVMLNFNLTPHRLYNFEFSAGVSAGYLISSRNKTITSDEGKQRVKDDFDLRHWKFSYVADLTLGVVSFYGSYAMQSMFQRGLNIMPYNVGIRIKPMDFFAKMESR